MALELAHAGFTTLLSISSARRLLRPPQPRKAQASNTRPTNTRASLCAIALPRIRSPGTSHPTPRHADRTLPASRSSAAAVRGVGCAGRSGARQGRWQEEHCSLPPRGRRSVGAAVPGTGGPVQLRRRRVQLQGQWENSAVQRTGLCVRLRASAEMVVCPGHLSAAAGGPAT